MAESHHISDCATNDTAVWRPIIVYHRDGRLESYEGVYEISSDGRVVSLHRRGRRRVLKLHPHPDGGHLCVSLCRDKRQTRLFVHRLVAMAFIGPPPSFEHIAAHWDGIPTNNVVANIRWATLSENARDKRRHGTAPVGAKCWNAKFTEDQIVEIRRRSADGESVRALAIEFGVHSANISGIVLGKTWATSPGPIRETQSFVLRGTAHRNAKLTPDLVRELRSLVRGGLSISAASRRFGVSGPAVSSVIKGETWQHVED